MVTTVARVRVKIIFAGIIFDLFHLNAAESKANASLSWQKLHKIQGSSGI